MCFHAQDTKNTPTPEARVLGKHEQAVSPCNNNNEIRLWDSFACEGTGRANTQEEGLLRLRVLGLDDTVIIFSDVNLANKSYPLSIVTLLLATHGAETTALITRI